MMKKIMMMAAALTMAVAIPTMPAAAQTGPSGSVTCVAQSPSAIGYGTAWVGETACSNALYQCAIRTPASQTCYALVGQLRRGGNFPPLFIEPQALS